MVGGGGGGRGLLVVTGGKYVDGGNGLGVVGYVKGIFGVG